MNLIEGMVNQFLETAVWAECGDLDQPPNDLEFSGAAREFAIARCKSFIEQAGGLIDEALECDDYDSSSLGHDLWLTQQGHGAGFWDRDQLGPVLGEKLTDLANAFGPVHIYDAGNGFYGLERG